MGELEENIMAPMDEDFPATNPIKCLGQLLKSKDMADLTIIIPGHNSNFKVHRLVLSMWSNVFQAMLFGPMAEGDTITLEEDPPEAFSWLLMYMYTGETELTSIALSLQVYQLANKYIMQHLQNVCSEYLIDRVNAVSVPEVLNFATLMEDEALINKCKEVLEESPDLFFSSPTIGKLNSDSLEKLLMENLHVSSETVIYQGILNWGRTHSRSKKEEITKLKLRQEVGKFLPHIRFLSMSLEEFVKNILTDNILTLEEVEAIQKNIACVPEVNLPPLFSINKDKRKILHNCSIMHGARVSGDGLSKFVSNPNILGSVKTNSIIYLSKLEYETDIGYKGTLAVRDSSGKKMRRAQFNGRVAEFDVLLKMLPEETYTFNISDIKSACISNHSYLIKENELISGHMMNNIFKPFMIYYYK